ncbi:MAG: DUF2141 domain-containing protein [Puniceicoccaceae bacterium]
MKRNSWVLLACLMMASNLLAAETASLTVRVTGLSSGQGQVFLSLFNTPDNFLKEPVLEKTLPAGESNSLTVHFPDLQPGTWAVSVFYDKDGNGKMKKGFLGIPKEPVGFSNDAKGSFGPPSFEDATFSLEADLEIVVKVGKAD